MPSRNPLLLELACPDGFISAWAFQKRGKAFWAKLATISENHDDRALLRRWTVGVLQAVGERSLFRAVYRIGQVARNQRMLLSTMSLRHRPFRMVWDCVG